MLNLFHLLFTIYAAFLCTEVLCEAKKRIRFVKVLILFAKTTDNNSIKQIKPKPKLILTKNVFIHY